MLSKGRVRACKQATVATPLRNLPSNPAICTPYQCTPPPCSGTNGRGNDTQCCLHRGVQTTLIKLTELTESKIWP